LLRSASVRKFLVGCVHFFSSAAFPPYLGAAGVLQNSERDVLTLLSLHFPSCPFFPSLLYHRNSFELFAETQRDITPEQAAQKLREKDAEVHYKEKLAQ
jgi:hypothetical protein